MKTLLDASADLYVPNMYGKTPMDHVRENVKPVLCAHVRKLGALHCASANGDIECIKALLEAGDNVNVNTKNNYVCKEESMW
jgi:ankyrin repeat protein